ncbi:MAG: AAA-like domain-containing protein [Leptolyngbyaceae cyanobacterium]
MTPLPRNNAVMDADAALEFADCLVYAHNNKHLNDLERQVFIGSWQGKTYEEIYPFKAEYIEKSVAYRLWQKLSSVLGEKVTKKRLRGAVERALKQQKQISVIYRDPVPDAKLAQSLSEALQASGHRIFAANLDTLTQGGASWAGQREADLMQSDYFVLLLSPAMAMSEMVIEILQRIWDRHIHRYEHKPWLIAIHLCPEAPFSLNHDLRNYLAQASQALWKTPADEAQLIQDLLQIIQTGNPPPLANAMLANGIDADSTKGLLTSAEAALGRAAFPNLFEPTVPCLGIPNAILAKPDAALALAASAADALRVDSIADQPPPSPVADPELPRGQVRLASAFYVERSPQDSLCHEEILKPGALIRIKAPRQMGKTSLMARILYQAGEQGYQAIPLSFQHADQEIFGSLKQLLQWLCVRVARKLRLPPRLDEFWTDTYGSKDNCTAYFEDYLLPEISTPLVLGMDEVDRVFQYPAIVDDFFGLLRAWYEEAGYGSHQSSLWEKLRLIVVHSTEVYIPLDINQSPFNVGLPIELQDFTLAQVTDLAHRHGLQWHADQIHQLMDLVGGHPYLVRVAFYYIVQQQLTLEKLLESAPTESGIYGDHLRRHLWNLHRNDALAQAFSQVLAHQNPVSMESEKAFKLHSLGLVKLQGNGVIPRFDLYRKYFSDRLNSPPSNLLVGGEA